MKTCTPNLFIIGAPKCGTTALSQYLSEHPKIFITKPKEPCFFCQDVKKTETSSIKEYLSLYKDAKPFQVLRGEGSVWNLYSPTAIKRIYNFNPESSLIVMLRNPVDIVYSLFYQGLADGTENADNFEQAWEWQDDRLKGKKLTKHKDILLTQYRDIGKIGEQLKRARESFPASQIKIVFYDDFKKNTRNVYKEILFFLRLGDDIRKVFPIVNANKTIRIKKLQQLLNRIERNPVAQNCLKYFKRTFDIQNVNTVSRLKKMNIVQGKQRPPLPLEFEHKLKMYFKPDIKLLSSLTGRDLTSWLE